MSTAPLYDLDFAEWARQNAELLRSGRIAEADLEHIAEEIEGLSKSERHKLYSRLLRLIEHLLKWEFQPERRGASWRRTIILQRRGLKRVLKENPSFRPIVAQLATEAYDDAVAIVAKILDRPREEFPMACPYTLDQLQDEQFLPCTQR
jgi:hypothetical protein